MSEQKGALEQKGTLKLDGWKPQRMPDPEMRARLRQYIREVVFSKWNTNYKPVGLMTIFYLVQDRVLKDREKGVWPKEWGVPGKRTIDRRVNEAANPKFYGDQTPKIVAVTAGLYQPNPELFKEP